MIEKTFTTSEAAVLLNITHGNVHYLIRSRKINLPKTNGSGDYVWTEKDIDSARVALTLDLRTRSKAKPAERKSRPLRIEKKSKSDDSVIDLELKIADLSEEVSCLRAEIMEIKSYMQN